MDFVGMCIFKSAILKYMFVIKRFWLTWRLLIQRYDGTWKWYAISVYKRRYWKTIKWSDVKDYMSTLVKRKRQDYVCRNGEKDILISWDVEIYANTYACMRRIKNKLTNHLPFKTSVEPLSKDQESFTLVAKSGAFLRNILYKSCLFYPSWQATSFERPPSWVAFIEGFHCNMQKVVDHNTRGK